MRNSRLNAFVGVLGWSLTAATAVAAEASFAPNGHSTPEVPVLVSEPTQGTGISQAPQHSGPQHSGEPRGLADADVAPAAEVRLGEEVVFTLRADLGDKGPDERARQAGKALSAAIKPGAPTDVRVARDGDIVVVYAGKTPVVRLSQHDAASEHTSLDALADDVAEAVEDALARERRRNEIANTVFSLSLAVFFALVALYLVRKLSQVAAAAGNWIESRDQLFALRLRNVELLRTETLQSFTLIALSIAKWFLQGAIVYSWLAVVLSLFEATRGYTDRFTGFLLAPIAQLTQRAVMTLPLLIVALTAALAVWALVRFVGLFFASVARHETSLSWVPPDLALPTSFLLRAGIIVTALVFAAPVMTGAPDGAFVRLGNYILLSLALACAPLLGNVVVGTVVLFGRRLRPGQFVELDGASGRVRSINLFELRLETGPHAEARVPHLLLLLRRLVISDGLAAEPLRLSVAADASPEKARAVLAAAAAQLGVSTQPELDRASSDGLEYLLAVPQQSPSERAVLLTALVEALRGAGLELGARPDASARRRGPRVPEAGP